MFYILNTKTIQMGSKSEYPVKGSLYIISVSCFCGVSKVDPTTLQAGTKVKHYLIILTIFVWPEYMQY